jgi:hypothetical protein
VFEHTSVGRRPLAQERQFWANHDSVDYVDWSKAERAVFPNLKPTARSVTARLTTNF